MSAEVSETSRRPGRTATVVCLFLGQVAGVASLIPWLMMAGLSLMVFDAPDSEKQVGPWLFVATIWSYPAWVVFFFLVSWLLFVKRRYVGALVTTAVPLLPAVALLVWVLWMMVME